MNLRIIVFSLVLAAALAALLQKSVRTQLLSWLKKMYAQRHLIIALLAFLVLLLRLIYPGLNDKIRDFRKNI